MTFCRSIYQKINRKVVIYILSAILPLAALPLAISPNKEEKCAYVMLIVATYWLLDTIPIYVTALLPVALFPFLGILSSTEVCSNYMKESHMMFIGGLIVAVAVENSHLHERIALKVLLAIGTEIKWLMLGFMLITMFLSMWVSNTATTAMMVPIVEAVVEKIFSTEEIGLEDRSSSLTESKEVFESADDRRPSFSNSVWNPAHRRLKITLLLCVCYAANIGGTGTLTGTGSNIVFKGLVDDLHPDSQEVSFASWMAYNIPGMIICIALAWFYLWLIFVKLSKVDIGFDSKEKVRAIISSRYKNLGPITAHEKEVTILFVILVLLWIFREPKFIPGWGTVISPDGKFSDSVPAMAVCLLMFFLPINFRQMGDRTILDWKTAQEKVPWGVVLLSGGGFALSHGVQKSGLSIMLVSKMSALSVMSPGAIIAILCFATSVITEIMSNTSAASILIPIFSQMAVMMRINPLYFMLPITLSCSYAFMLPAGSAPNAIAFEKGNMNTMDMVKPGFVMNMICCGVQLLMINTLGVALFDLNTFPEWANHSVVLNNSIDVTNSMLLNSTSDDLFQLNTTSSYSF